MQTPITQLIERLEAKLKTIIIPDSTVQPADISALQFAITKAKELLEVEREVIIEAWESGSYDGSVLGAENWYNEKYKQ